MHDEILNIGNTVIQHGKYNDRIYLMKLSPDDFPDIIYKLDRIAYNNSYSKIFIKVPSYAKEGFINSGFEVEASIPNFYNGQEVFFMAKFFTESRKRADKPEEMDNVLQKAQNQATKHKVPELMQGFAHRICGLADARQMAQVYRAVFVTYPFPIYDPDYIMRTMARNVVYFGIWHHRKIIALSSAELDNESGNCEMTDFATLPEYLGRGLSLYLLQMMEFEVGRRQIATTYTIARALSYGMNITFAKMGYIYSGTLVNNTNISGHLESMNVWYKDL